MLPKRPFGFDDVDRTRNPAKLHALVFTEARHLLLPRQGIIVTIMGIMDMSALLKLIITDPRHVAESGIAIPCALAELLRLELEAV